VQRKHNSVTADFFILCRLGPLLPDCVCSAAEGELSDSLLHVRRRGHFGPGIYNEGVKGSLSIFSNNLSGVELWRFAHANRVMNSNQRWRWMFTDNLIPETCNFALHFV
jgi:hypothetical protein